MKTDATLANVLKCPHVQKSCASCTVNLDTFRMNMDATLANVMKLTAMHASKNSCRTMVANAGWMKNAMLRKRFQRGAMNVEIKPQ